MLIRDHEGLVPCRKGGDLRGFCYSVPTRYVGKALDAKVDWVAETQTVIITLGETQPPVQLPVQPPTDGVVTSIPIDMKAA